MDWHTYIDIYCERTAPGLLNEPLNAVTNAAFFVTAFLAMRATRRAGGATARDGFLWLLIALVVLIGLGSTAFHTFAERWSLIADVAPITAFIYAFFFFAMRRFVTLSTTASLAATAIFLAASVGLGEILPPDLPNLSWEYLPALAAMLAVGTVLIRLRHPAGHWVLGAGGVFAISLTFRTIDPAICATLPIGTHFVWHILNATVLYLLLMSAVRYGHAEAPAPSGAEAS